MGTFEPAARTASTVALLVCLCLLAPGCDTGEGEAGTSEAAPPAATARTDPLADAVSDAASDGDAVAPASETGSVSNNGSGGRFARHEEAGDGASKISRSVPPSGPLASVVDGPADKTGREYDDNCTSSGCHALLVQRRWLHAPVAVGACNLCHVAEGEPEDHRFAAGRSCDRCHRSEERPVLHEPYAQGDCGICHDPHGGESRGFFVTDSLNALCLECHERREVTHPHVPVESGDCTGCHEAHDSEHEHLLKRPDKELCLGCHKPMRDLLKKEREDRASYHEPVLQDCRSCHLAHGGEHRAFLVKEPRALCESCHDPVLESAGVQSAHLSELWQGECTACHAPHHSTHPKLLVASVDKLCLGCHDREIELPSGRKIANFQEFLATTKFHHGPVEEGLCVACHHAHSSPRRKLLRGEYPEELYVAFDPNTYDLCFFCHDRRLSDEERTTLTDFRHGDRNLHYVHVHREKSRSCTFCHDPHGSMSPKQMRQTVSFGEGKWALPIGFLEDASGGSCTTGCHKWYRYDNTNPPGSPPKPSPGPRK